MPTEPDEPEDKSTTALKALEQELHEGRIRVSRNLLGEPYFTVNQAAEGAGNFGDGFHQRLFHRDTAAWISQFMWAKKEFALSQGEVERVLRVLSGSSLRHRTAAMTDPDLLRILETEPVAASIVEYLDQNSKKLPIEMGMHSLWRDLRRMATQRKLLLLGRNRFPGGSNVFSRKLRELADVLRALRINVSIRRANGSQVVIGRLDDTGLESSPQLSDPKPEPVNDLRAQDDQSALLAMLQQRKSNSFTRPQENQNENSPAHHHTSRHNAVASGSLESIHRKLSDDPPLPEARGETPEDGRTEPDC